MVFIIVQTLLLATLAIAFFVFADPLLIVIPTAAAVLAWFFVAAGVVLAAAALVSLGSATRLSPQPRSASLVDRGIYRYVRHPMYSSSILVTVGLIILRPRLSVIITGLAVVAFYLFKAHYEEGLLLRHYPGYDEYRRRTRGVLLTRRPHQRQ